ncbi:MAG: TerC family protein [Phycisphaeraceae bacterium]|nr:TerC family protein [Phycisphaeraceae bacterium]
MSILLSAAEATSGSDLKVWAYVAFIGLVVFFLALDLGVFHREAHEVSFKEAMAWSAVWIAVGLGFTVFVYFGYENHWLGLGLDTAMYNPLAGSDPSAPLIVQGSVSGAEAAKQYVTGYVVEKSLAMDNIFVIAMIFGFFAIPAKYQHRVLFWGIVGALLMRGGMIAIGAELISRYMWVLIVFGGFLLLTALKMALIKSESDPGKNPLVRLCKRYFPVTEFFDGQRFFTRRTQAPRYVTDPGTGKTSALPPAPGELGTRLAVTPLFLALIMVEITDLVFAVDSIPAIFAITPDAFIVFTSNIFAILGLRSLYFCLAAMISKFRYLKPALILILAFVGVKLLLLSVPPYLDDWGLASSPVASVKIDTTVSLVAVLATLGVAVVLSILRPAPAEGAGH